MTKPQIIQCPVCQTETSFEWHPFIDGSQQNDLKAQVMTGDLFAFECDHCGAKRRLTLPLTYQDSQDHLLYFLIPKDQINDTSHQEMIQSYFFSLADQIDHYQIRLLTDSRQLIEKLTIAEAGYQDTEIELVKLLTDGLFQNQFIDLAFSDCYFYIHQGKEKFLYLTDQGPQLVDFHQELLSLVRQKYKKSLNQSYHGQLRTIDQAWATQVLQHKETGQDSDQASDHRHPN